MDNGDHPDEPEHTPNVSLHQGAMNNDWVLRKHKPRHSKLRTQLSSMHPQRKVHGQRLDAQVPNSTGGRCRGSFKARYMFSAAASASKAQQQVPSPALGSIVFLLSISLAPRVQFLCCRVRGRCIPSRSRLVFRTKSCRHDKATNAFDWTTPLPLMYDDVRHKVPHT